MPTRSTHLPGLMSGLRLYQAQPGRPPSWRPPMTLISPLSWEALGEDVTGLAASNFVSTAFPLTDRGIGYPFELADYFLVQKVWWMNGTTATTDTADVAVYTEAGGASSRLVAGGGAAIATANVIQEINCTDTLLAPGRYWCVYAQSGTTATPIATGALPGLLDMAGVAMMNSGASAGVLGTTWTPAQNTGVLPFFGIASRTQVA